MRKGSRGRDGVRGLEQQIPEKLNEHHAKL